MKTINSFKKEKSLFTNVDCISMYVPSLEEGLKFYLQFGFKLLWKASNSCGLSMSDDITELVLCTDKNPMVDFKVESVIEAITKFIEAGGKVEYGPFDIDIGKCAVVVDPFGNTYCILDMTKGTYDTDINGNTVGVSKK